MEQEFLTQPLPVGPEQAAEAERILHKYKAGKAALDRRLIDNELWFRMAHWKQYKNRMMEGKPQPSSGWLFNSIASKHADAMGQLPRTLRPAQGGGRRGDRPHPFQHPAGGAGAGGLRAGVFGQLVAQAQTGHRGQGHLLGPRGPGRAGGDRHPLDEPFDALLGAGDHGHPGQPPLFQPELKHAI